MTFFELSLPFEQAKQKGKQVNGITPSERQSLEIRIDTLVRLGYTVIAVNHIVQSKFQRAISDFSLRKREGVIILKRLTIVLDEAAEKGCGLTNNNLSELSTYDLIAIQPTTKTTFSQACLTYPLPGPLTAHIISLDIASQPKLPFYLKHTLVRTAIRNGAVFEIGYAPAVAPDDDNKRRNWWANAREVLRVTKGKNLLVSGGVRALADLRAPLDVANLITLLEAPQDRARDALSNTPKSLVLRAQTRKTYRAILSEPTLILPGTEACSPVPPGESGDSEVSTDQNMKATVASSPAKKRTREPEAETVGSVRATSQEKDGDTVQEQRKKKKRKGKDR